MGVLAQLAGARQPQTTKHLQTLERAGIAVSERTGQRRVYSLRPGPLRDLAATLTGLADDAERTGGPGTTYERHRLQVQRERLAAREAGWADARTFRFERTLPTAQSLDRLAAVFVADEDPSSLAASDTSPATSPDTTRSAP